MTAYVPSNSSTDKVSVPTVPKCENDTAPGKDIFADYQHFQQSSSYVNPQALNAYAQVYGNQFFANAYDQLQYQFHQPHHQMTYNAENMAGSGFYDEGFSHRRQYVAPAHPVMNYSSGTNVTGDTANNRYQVTNTSEDIQIELDDAELWKKFHSIGTEMIITKSGRRIFPTLKLKIKGLDPDTKYIVAIDILPYDDNRYKYNNNSWMITGKAEPHIQNFPYIHPESPVSGSQLMKQPLSFKKLKVTNNPSAQGQIVLNSLHKYNPRINIFKYDDLTGSSTCVHSCSFVETIFIAVTAYQNEAVTNLKIDHNPFAKGFRENHRRDRTLKRDYRTVYGQPEEDQNKRARIETYEQRRTRLTSNYQYLPPSVITTGLMNHSQNSNAANAYMVHQHQRGWR
ncbi:hypothetical protein ACOME3_007428 [Neoechinorhynchus agilis]